MNSGLVDVYHKDSDSFSDDQEYFWQYCCLPLSEHNGTKIQTSIIQLINEQLYGGSN